MPLTRWQINTRESVATPFRDGISNTLYFNVTTIDPFEPADYQSLGDDLWDIWATRSWVTGRYVDLRAYDMGDPDPKPQKYHRMGPIAGTINAGVPQVAIALSYYADRNLPRQRGRIFTGPWPSSADTISAFQQNAVLALAPAFADLGGVNVDWSIYSPSNDTATRISDAWVDDSWDVIRSRKLPQEKPRVVWSGDG